MARAQDPPPGLARNIARVETETAEAQQQYSYRQTVEIDELDPRGMQRGRYRETRDIIFIPGSEREEKMVKPPEKSLQRLILTEEDFRDVRQVQPFAFTLDSLRLYETRYQGDEMVDGVRCHRLFIRPRQIFTGQRLFEGVLLARVEDLAIVRTEGRAVPQLLSTKSENLFPAFATTRQPVDGKHWFPVRTEADDTLHFRGGAIRIRMRIRYSEYKRFGSDSTVKFEK